jgi:ATP-binding cassette, subfamily B, multidrug efflux pump
MSKPLLQVEFGNVFKKLLPILRPYRLRFFCGALLIFATTAIEVYNPILIGKVVDLVTGSKELPVLYQLCALYFFLLVAKAILETFQAYVIQTTGQGVTHDLRCLLLTHVEHLSVPYFDKNPSGRLLTRVTNDIKALSELFTASISVLALDVMIILGTLIAMFVLHWKLALFVLATFPFLFLTVKFFGRKLAVAYREVRRYLSEINAFLGENIGAIATIQRLSAEPNRLQRFEEKVEGHFNAQMESLRVYAMVQPYTNILNGLAMGTLIGVGGYWVSRGEISVGVLVAFFGYLRNLFQPIRDMVEKYNTFLSAMVAAERVIAVLEEPMEPSGGMIEKTDGDLGIRFDGVSFAYINRPVRALDNVSFDVPAGTSLAIVGRTGSGKSTLIRLLLKFYDLEKGSIRVGGEEISQWNTSSLRRLFGVVHQEMYFFGGTIRENLTLGQTGLSDEYLRKQCERAELWETVAARGGLDMPVYEGGSNLSLGERQLLAFARVMALDPPVLILDEATSSIDTLLEKKLIHAVNEVLKGRTSIVIAHRLSTIRHCNQVIEMHDGKKRETSKPLS